MISNAVIEAVKKEVQHNLDEQIELTRKLVQIPSVTGQEAEAQTFIAGLYQGAGL
ncbi:MAG: hypothetical protein JRF72_19715, partial [Deltaproteobacteria bacterium]|nr:hypothetical protein [Deltaproteobacteria bacterium]